MPYTFTQTPTDEMTQNWRAVVTILVTVPPNLPGLIASINPAVQIGGAFKIFDFAWLFGVRCVVHLLLRIVRRADAPPVLRISGRVFVALVDVPCERNLRRRNHREGSGVTGRDRYSVLIRIKGISTS